MSTPPTEDQRSEPVDISVFFGFLRRRGLIVLLAILVGGLVGYATSKAKSDKYEASAKILLRGPADSTGATTAGNQLEPGVPDSPGDREDLATADPVLALAANRLTPKLGEARTQKLLGEVGSSSGQDSATVEITSTAGSPEAAALVANAVAASVIQYRKDSTVKRLKRAIKVAERQLAGSPASPTVGATAQGVADMRQSVATEDGHAEITEHAAPPNAASSPRPSRDAFAGAFAGLLIGLALAMVREQLDRRLKRATDLERVFGLPVLASVPKSRALSASNGKALDRLPAVDAESFQMLRANLRFLDTDRELRSVVVTSPDVGDGKSTVALNLAKADASAGKSVLLVEADMRRPRLEKLLGTGPGPGLATYLADPTKTVADVISRVPVAHHANGDGSGALTMDVMTAGSVPDNPSELINSQRMVELVREAEQTYELVVIDTAPAGVVADAIPLMSHATAVVIVGRVGRVTGTEADRLREQLERIDAPSFGLVANFAPGAETGYGYY
jgi:capsular exopolysaccharide synthesis family protein